MGNTVFPGANDAYGDTPGVNAPSIITPTFYSDAINALEAATGQDGSRVKESPVFTSGTAVQNTYGHDATFAIITATAGTYALAVGPTNACAVVLATAQVTAAVDKIVATVPAGWWIKITLTTSTGPADWTVY